MWRSQLCFAPIVLAVSFSRDGFRLNQHLMEGKIKAVTNFTASSFYRRWTCSHRPMKGPTVFFKEQINQQSNPSDWQWWKWRKLRYWKQTKTTRESQWIFQYFCACGKFLKTSCWLERWTIRNVPKWSVKEFDEWILGVSDTDRMTDRIRITAEGLGRAGSPALL